MLCYNFLGIVCISCVLTGSGCATIFDSGQDYLLVTSDPEGASVKIDGLLVGNTPLTVAIYRDARMISFSKTGYLTISSPVPKQFNGWTLVNLFLFHGAPVGFVIDAAAGNMWKPRGSISTNLPKAESGDSQDGNGSDSIAVWLGRIREYAELAKADPLERK